VLAVQNGAVLELAGQTPRLIYGQLNDSDSLTLTRNTSEDKLVCSGEFEAADLRIAGSSTTVADLIGEVAALRQEMAEVRAFVGMLPPPASPPPDSPSLPPSKPPASPPSSPSPSPANPPPDTAVITASSRYSTHTTTGPTDALSSWQVLAASSASSTYCDRTLTSASFQRSTCGCSSFCRNTATHVLIQWHIGPCAVGEYIFSASTDFGRFGYFEVDSQYAAKSPGDYGVPNSIDNRFQRHAALSVNLTEGHHYLRMIGFEDCCGAGNSLSFRPPGGTSLSIITTSALDALSAC